MSRAERLPSWLKPTLQTSSSIPKVTHLFICLAILTGGVVAVGWGLARLIEFSQMPVCWQDIHSESTAGSVIKLEISGQVKHPGVYQLKKGQRLVDVVELAGGFTKQAAKDYIAQSFNLASKVEDGQKIYIPEETDLITPTAPAVLITEDKIPMSNSPVVVTPKSTLTQDSKENSALISINKASQSDLEKLKGVGEKRAAKIIQNRPFTNLTELVDLKLVPPSVFDNIKQKISL